MERERIPDVAAQTIRSELHEPIETWSEEELVAARRYVEFLRSGYTDMLSWVLDTAPEDDEPTTPEEEEGLAEAREDVRLGRTFSMDEVKRLFSM